MSKELVDGQERFDGFPVTIYEGRFAGSFELPEELGAKLEFDDVVSFVVTCTVGKATIDSTKLGDLKRTNAMSVQNVAPASQKAVDEAYAANGFTLDTQLPLEIQSSDEEEVDFDEDDVFTPETAADEPWTPPAPQPLQPKALPVDFTGGPDDDVQVLGEPLEKQDKVLAGFLEQP